MTPGRSGELSTSPHLQFLKCLFCLLSQENTTMPVSASTLGTCWQLPLQAFCLSLFLRYAIAISYYDNYYILLRMMRYIIIILLHLFSCSACDNPCYILYAKYQVLSIIVNQAWLLSEQNDKFRIDTTIIIIYLLKQFGNILLHR